MTVLTNLAVCIKVHLRDTISQIYIYENQTSMNSMKHYRYKIYFRSTKNDLNLMKSNISLVLHIQQGTIYIYKSISHT